jgi:hypothetical protein
MNVIARKGIWNNNWKLIYLERVENTANNTRRAVGHSPQLSLYH